MTGTARSMVIESQVFDKEAYDYTKKDLEASVSCPQCRAEEMLERIPNDCAYSLGQRMAAHEAVLHPHECGKEPVKQEVAADPSRADYDYFDTIVQ